ncbi:Lon protease 1 [Paraliobacillus sp. PM-2]|uniref:SepM family pheromone-processing serine protease n=1 Tax=Paraliobacillus sp. PM-2 TaxID=1462524 RepID=UPI00061C298C|nr:SepM family pheromone-processing serine protease [Paraliobacillus sp. PM-2]CQR47807.1 Lon protease 1 [Paraliobacillus sp. PM-2]
MVWNKKRLILYSFLLVILMFVTLYRMPYYIYKPGTADALNNVVKVTDGFDSEGDMHLVTVRGGQATPLQYVWALLHPFQDIRLLSEVFPEGISQEEYFQVQLQMMENSQESSMVVAYKAANKEIDITYNGVYVVSVLEGMPAEEVLQTGDKIIAVNNQRVENAESLIDLVDKHTKNSKILLTIKRDDSKMKVEVGLAAFPNNPDKVGMGIQLVTDREVNVDQELNFSSGDIGGPSAGLMFALEIYDQLTKEDLTKGYQIAGTGEISYEGDVMRIGGIDKKVVAADEEGCDIFFAPNESGVKDSNYHVALQTAKEINSSMKIVPVDTFDDAIEYLSNLK